MNIQEQVSHSHRQPLMGFCFHSAISINTGAQIHIFASANVPSWAYLLGIMSDDLPLKLLSGTKLEVQLKES